VIMGAGIIGPECELWSPARPDGPSTGDFIAERLVQEKEIIRKEELAQLIYGDVGGVLLEQPGLCPDDQAMVDRLNAGWTGMKAKDLRRIAQAAGRNGSGGVILVASSAAKADVLFAAIRRGLVNQLVVDEPLMARLVDLAAAIPARTYATNTRPRP